jgi:hypothetical protein
MRITSVCGQRIIDMAISSSQHKDMPWKLRVARGEAETSYINKFGHNEEIDTNTTPEDVWSHGGVYTFTADGGAPYFISSSNALDTQVIALQCLTEDASGNWNVENVTVTLQGLTKVPIAFPSGDDPVRFYRGFNVNGTDLVGDVHIYEDDTLTAGVPDTDSKVRGGIRAGDNQTEMCIYTVPSGFIGYFMQGYVSLSSGVRSASMEFTYSIRVHGGVFRVTGRTSLDSAGSGSWQYEYAVPPPLPAKTDVKITVVNVTANDMGAVGGFDIELHKL